ncbi:hypothetical protein EUTSA_v10019408mg [Eutrema salsugineum]|uniref:Uncharacterized protein n=1 Tax=Eutrema salsugineum TaxID=72664 RepID=V4KJT4_EUTSA|nr:hypothetical protein EUTSA_v10019408mg [Eutrema salsugineum]
MIEEQLSNNTKYLTHNIFNLKTKRKMRIGDFVAKCVYLSVCCILSSTLEIESAYKPKFCICLYNNETKPI